MSQQGEDADDPHTTFDNEISVGEEDVKQADSIPATLSGEKRLSEDESLERDVPAGEVKVEKDRDGSILEDSSQLPPNPPIVIQSPLDTDNNEEAGGEVTRQPDEELEVEPRASRERVDSVPLKRYEVDSHLSTITPVKQAVEEHNIARPQYHGPARISYSETEDAGLDFVEVKLDQPMNYPSPYGLGSQFASRSAVEIRQDSISSNSEAAKRVALEADERERRTSEQYLHRRERSASDDGSSISSRSSRRTTRSVEGRYMGRRSRTVSRATSPEPNGTLHQPASNDYALDPPTTDVSVIESRMGPFLTLAVAGEDGEVSLVTTPATFASNANGVQENIESAADESHEESDAQASQSGNKSPAEKQLPEEKEQVPHTIAAASEGDDHQSIPQPTPTTAESPNKLNDAADKEQGKGKRRRESTYKPSALEQHMSRTRMMTLPPKSKQEDVKHLHDYEEMMKLSKEKEQKKQQEMEEKRRQKDAELQEDMKVWDKEILPSWTRARRETHLRKLWWKGIPPSIRGRLWALACGNNQMLPRNLYSKASAEAQKRREDGSFPLSDLRAIEADIEETLPSLKLFQKDIGALHSDLFSVLCALVIVRLDQRGLVDKGKGRQVDLDNTVQVYQQGSASLAAMLLSNLTTSETLIALLNLIAERPWLRALYASPTSARAGKEDAAAFERVFDTLLADQMPKVYANMQARGVRPSSYVREWIKTVFVPFLPFDLVARLWDCILLDEGDAFMFRICIGLYSLLSARLYVPDKAELISVLRGNNRAALSVWDRIRTDNNAEPTSPPPLSPGSDQSKAHFSLTIEAPADSVPLDNIYGGQYDINEINFFQVLDEQVNWWKDSTLERLLDRELVT